MALNSIKRARREQLRWEKQFDAMRQHLELQYNALRQEAFNCRIKASLGLLGSAKFTLNTLQEDPRSRRLKRRLDHAFQLLGAGFFTIFRRFPPKLQTSLEEYAELLWGASQRLEDLRQRLSHSQQVLHAMRQLPEFCAQHHFRLALISPEVAETFLQLWGDRLESREQIRQFVLRGLERRVAGIQQWLSLLGETMDDGNHRAYQVIIDNVVRQMEDGTKSSVKEVCALYKNLDEIVQNIDPLAKKCSFELLEKAANLLRKYKKTISK
jgi:hypothetical protein